VSFHYRSLKTANVFKEHTHTHMHVLLMHSAHRNTEQWECNEAKSFKTDLMKAV